MFWDSSPVWPYLEGLNYAKCVCVTAWNYTAKRIKVPKEMLGRSF